MQINPFDGRVITKAFNPMESHVLILAGGLGTRLRSVVPDTPKVLAPVLGKPFLFWLLDKLYKSGVNNV